MFAYLFRRTVGIPLILFLGQVAGQFRVFTDCTLNLRQVVRSSQVRRNQVDVGRGVKVGEGFVLAFVEWRANPGVPCAGHGVVHGGHFAPLRRDGLTDKRMFDERAPWLRIPGDMRAHGGAQPGGVNEHHARMQPFELHDVQRFLVKRGFEASGQDNFLLKSAAEPVVDVLPKDYVGVAYPKRFVRVLDQTLNPPVMHGRREIAEVASGMPRRQNNALQVLAVEVVAPNVDVRIWEPPA